MCTTDGGGVNAVVAMAMMEVGLDLPGLESRNIGKKGRVMVGVETGGRNVLNHSGFMLIKYIVQCRTA